MDAALLFVRLVVGLSLAAHGVQKLFGWFGGYGLAGTGGFFENLGFRPGRTFAFFAGLGETGGGLLTALGLGGALGPAALVMVMLVAIFAVHIGKGFFITNGGWELNSAYIAGAVAIAYVGSGAFSLDTMLGLTYLRSPQWASICMAAAVLLAVLNLLMRRPAPAQSSN
ncbi:MAG TPA: DoxX family protein [Candidatus Acidoferrum sp.]|nr:DoxX family protein [Candidatus Acidoferrum sp.]